MLFQWRLDTDAVRVPLFIPLQLEELDADETPVEPSTLQR